MVICGIAAPRAAREDVAFPTSARPPRRHLGRRAFVLAVVLILILGAFAYRTLSTSYEQNRESSVDGLGRTARLTSALGQSLVGLGQQQVVVLAKAPMFRAGDAAEIESYLASVNPATLGFTAGMVWTDAGGVVRARWVSPIAAPDIDYESLDAVATARRGKPAVESLAIAEGGPFRPIVFAVPTYDDGAAVNGVLVGTVLLDSSSQDLLREFFGTDAVLVVDSSGELVFGARGSEGEPLGVARRVLDRMADEEAGAFADVDGYAVGYARIEGADWTAIVEQPRDVLFAADRNQFRRSVIGLMSLVGIVVLGAAYAAIRLDRVHQREIANRTLFETLLAELPVGVAAVDRRGNVVVTNARADEAMGERPEPGTRAPEVLDVAFDAMERGVVTAREDVRPASGESDAERRVSVRAAPVTSAGRVRGAAVIVEDVTDARRRARRAAQFADLAAGLAAAQTRDEVAAVVASGAAAFDASAGIVVLRDPNRPDRLMLASTAGLAADAIDGWEVMDAAASTPVAEAARTGEPVFATVEDGPTRFPEMGDLLERSGNTAWAALPLRSAGKVDGALGLSFRTPDLIDGDARERLIGFAALVSQELDRASRRGLEHDLALVLQRGLLQPADGVPADLAVESRYQPAEDHLDVGGDFFDVLPLADGGAMIVIGDVVGHGIDAASAMGQLRSAVRALSATTSSPAKLLELLDRFAAIVPSCAFATAAIVVVAPDRRSLTYSLAGHPPPLLDSDGAVRRLDAALSRPIGVYPIPRPEASVVVAPGATLCLYTDGLIERRDSGIDEGLGRLEASMAAHRDASCAQLADAVLADLAGGGRQRDDVALVCARF